MTGIYNRLRTSGIRRVDGSLHLVWCQVVAKMAVRLPAGPHALGHTKVDEGRRWRDRWRCAPQSAWMDMLDSYAYSANVGKNGKVN